MRHFARICAHARSWREFAKCRFAHFPSFFSVHVDTYGMRFKQYTGTQCVNLVINDNLSSA